MIFSLVSSAQEWLNVKWDDFKKEEEARVQQKQKEIEEAEQVWMQCETLLDQHFSSDFFIDLHLKSTTNPIA